MARRNESCYKLTTQLETNWRDMKTLTAVALFFLTCLFYLAPIQAATLSKPEVGEPETIIIRTFLDPRIMQLLEAEKLKYTIDDDGDYLVRMMDSASKNIVSIWIISYTSAFNALEVREIRAITHTFSTPPSGKIATKLLRRNAVIKIGAWSLARSGDKFTLQFSIKLDAEMLRASTLRELLNFVALTSGGMQKEISSLGDEIWEP